jgi:outer membrane protein, heavy metal efflux system
LEKICARLLLFSLAPFCVFGQINAKRLSLHEAVNIALSNNANIKKATENISATDGRFWSGISLPQPEIGVSYQYTPVNSGLSNFGERTFEVKQSIEFPYIYFLKGSRLNKEKEIAVYNLELTKLTLTNQVKTSYYRVLAKQHQVKYAEENLKISEAFFKKTEVGQIAGEATNLEKLTAKVQNADALNNLETAKNEFATAWAELNYALGFGRQNYDYGWELTDSLSFADYKITLERLYESIDQTNPQIKTSELTKTITSIEKDIAWSSLLPNINLSYFRQTRDGNNGFYGASFGISVPLWFMFEQKGNIQTATANQSIAESEALLAKSEIALKLKNAFADFENCSRQAKLYANDILPQAEEIHKSAIKSYDAGELTYFEYLQAKQTLINSRNSYVGALFSYYQSVFRIEEISGQNIIDKSELEK